VAAQLGRSRIRMISPNCLGLMSPIDGLNATFAQTVARAGNVAFFEPERGVAHADPGLEPQRAGGL
jgi:acyl-CoA synthetase (NDP forming)